MAIRLPARSRLGGNRYFPPKPNLDLLKEIGGGPETRFQRLQIPPEGAELIAASTTTTFNVRVNSLVYQVDIDVPRLMASDLQFDRRRIHRVTDNQGQGGSVRLAEPGEGGLQVNQATLTVTNNKGTAQEVRYIIRSV